MKRCQPLKMPRPNQPVRVLVQYTGWNVVHRWITFPTVKAYFDRCVSRYGYETEQARLSRLRRRFRIVEITWDGKK